MNEDFLKLIYQSLKRQFDGISKKSWIWVDFFENEEKGFSYFKEQISNDEDFEYLKDKTYYLGNDLEELSYDIAAEIASKLRSNAFLSECEQCMLSNVL